MPTKKRGKGVCMAGEKQLLMTMTGEIHQPVRLYYTVYDQAAVLKVFSKLRCMDEDQDSQRWVWLYHGEAKKLKFHTSYSEAVWKQSLYKVRSYAIGRARPRTDLLDNRSLAMLLEISKRLI